MVTTTNLHQPFPARSFPMHLSSKSYTLDGAVGNTYLPPTQSVRYPEKTTPCMLRLDIETRTECGPHLSEERRERSIPPRSAVSPADFLIVDSEPNQVTYSSVTHTPNNTNRETGLGQAQVSYCASPKRGTGGDPRVGSELRRGGLTSEDKFYPVCRVMPPRSIMLTSNL